MTPHDIRNLAYTLTEADDYNIAMSNFARAELERRGISDDAMYAFLMAVADFAETQEGRIVWRAKKAETRRQPKGVE